MGERSAQQESAVYLLIIEGGDADMAVALIVTVLTVIYASQALRLSAGSLRSIGPGAYPLALVVGMGLCLLIIIAKELKAGKKSQKHAEPSARGYQVAGIAATLAYALTLEPLGYLLTTPVYVFVLALIFGMLQRAKKDVEGLSWRKLVKTAILAAAGVTGLGYLLFHILFDFHLP
jgi:hypothetical protein